MSVKVIPRSYLYVCDVCNAEHHQGPANGQYTEGVPDDWQKLVIIRGRGLRTEALHCRNCTMLIEFGIEQQVRLIKGLSSR